MIEKNESCSISSPAFKKKERERGKNPPWKRGVQHPMVHVRKRRRSTYFLTPAFFVRASNLQRRKPDPKRTRHPFPPTLESDYILDSTEQKRVAPSWVVQKWWPWVRRGIVSTRNRDGSRPTDLHAGSAFLQHDPAWPPMRHLSESERPNLGKVGTEHPSAMGVTWNGSGHGSSTFPCLRNSDHSREYERGTGIYTEAEEEYDGEDREWQGPRCRIQGADHQRRSDQQFRKRSTMM